MIIYFIILFVFIVSLFFAIYFKKKYLSVDISGREEDIAYNFSSSCAVATTLLGTLLFVCTLAVLHIRGFQDMRYEEMLTEYEVLTAQLARVQEYGNQNYIVSGDFGSLEKVYADVSSYNMEVRKAKIGVNNLWINWFYCPRYTELQEIPLN
jgi:hypothetical protein